MQKFLDGDWLRGVQLHLKFRGSLISNVIVFFISLQEIFLSIILTSNIIVSRELTEKHILLRILQSLKYPYVYVCLYNCTRNYTILPMLWFNNNYDRSTHHASKTVSNNLSFGRVRSSSLLTCCCETARNFYFTIQ